MKFLALWVGFGAILLVGEMIAYYRLGKLDNDHLDMPATLAFAILLFFPLGIVMLWKTLDEIRRHEPRCPEPCDPDEIWFPD